MRHPRERLPSTLAGPTFEQAPSRKWPFVFDEDAGPCPEKLGGEVDAYLCGWREQPRQPALLLKQLTIAMRRVREPSTSPVEK
jgi:hypothetical protein